MERAINSALELQSFLCTLARIEEFLPNLVTRVVDYDAPKWQAGAGVAVRSRSGFRKGTTGFMEAAGRGHKHACRETRSNLGLSHSEIVKSHQNGMRGDVLGRKRGARRGHRE